MEKVSVGQVKRTLQYNEDRYRVYLFILAAEIGLTFFWDRINTSSTSMTPKNIHPTQYTCLHNHKVLLSLETGVEANTLCWTSQLYVPKIKFHLELALTFELFYVGIHGHDNKITERVAKVDSHSCINSLKKK